MANRFWNFVTSLVPGALARAEDVNTNLSGLETGLDSIESEMDQAIRVTNAPGTTAISDNAAARANKLLQFDASGNVVLGTVIGNWQGDHADAAGTTYALRDVVKDAAGRIGLDNIYICTTAHTSTGTILTDTANWALVVDVTDAVTAKNAAETAQGLAEDARDAAQLAYDNFDDRYLGSFTTAAEPALDNDGNALLTGALYFNTSLNRMKIYNGAAWQLTTADAIDINVADAGGYFGASPTVESTLQTIGLTGIVGKTFTSSDDKIDNFPSGTLMLFQQTTAPIGWTKQVTHNDKVLRIVSGTASSGGTNAFSTVFAKTATDAHTLGLTEIPAHNHGGGSHTHTFPNNGNGTSSRHDVGIAGGDNSSVTGTTRASNGPSATVIVSQGGGLGHSHNMDIRVQYVDLIIASKD